LKVGSHVGVARLALSNGVDQECDHRDDEDGDGGDEYPLSSECERR
jgi:hypothetical protein